MPQAGYSGTPLAKKLGIKPGYRVKVKHAPPDYEDLVAPLPEGVVVSSRLRSRVDLWHVFVTSRAVLRREVRAALDEMPPTGALWVSWPKRSSGVRTDVTEDTIREEALPLGLVDVKVCAVDQTWSGLKLVIRRSAR